jgi:hypothetical protein
MALQRGVSVEKTSEPSYRAARSIYGNSEPDWHFGLAGAVAAAFDGPRGIRISKEVPMKKLIKSTRPRLALSRETVTLLSTQNLANVQGGSITDTRGIGCEPSGIRPCE